MVGVRVRVRVGVRARVRVRVEVKGGGDDLDHAAAHVDDGHVEGAAAQVEDHDALVTAHVEGVSERRGLGLAQQPHLDT